MNLTEEEKDHLYRKAEEFTHRMTEAGCDSILVLGTYPSGQTGTGFFRRSMGNSFANREHARNYVTDSEAQSQRQVEDQDD